MAKKRKIYKCEICGNIVEVLEEGEGLLVCCGQNMIELNEKTEDIGQEKHVPIIEIDENSIKVKVGDIPHPMEDSHYIQFIQLLIDKNTYTRYLEPGQIPEAEFEISQTYKEISARIYCNIHGLWKSK